MTDEPEFARIAGRVAHALRQAYGARIREVSWETTQPELVLDVELLGPVDVFAETMRMADATVDIVVEEGVTIICKPVTAGTENRRSAQQSTGYRPNPKHVSRIAVRLVEQIHAYHDPEWDFSDPDKRLLVWRAAGRIAEAEDREIAAILNREVTP